MEHTNKVAEVVTTLAYAETTQGAENRAKALREELKYLLHTPKGEAWYKTWDLNHQGYAPVRQPNTAWWLD